MSKPATIQPLPQPVRISRRLACRLAAAADTDFRSAMKAMREGAAAVRGRPGERLAEAAPTLGITLGQPTAHSEPKAA